MDADALTPERLKVNSHLLIQMLNVVSVAMESYGHIFQQSQQLVHGTHCSNDLCGPRVSDPDNSGQGSGGLCNLPRIVVLLCGSETWSLLHKYCTNVFHS